MLLKLRGHFALVIVTLLTAYTAGAQGSTLSDLTSSLPEKTWAQMPSNSSLNNLNIQDSHFYFGNTGVWDPGNNRVLWVGGPGSCCADVPTYKLLSYNEASDNWSAVNTPYTTSGHAYDGNAFGNGTLYFGLYGQRNVKTWNGSSWSTLPNLPFQVNVATAMTYFPEGGGPVYVDSAGRLAIFRNGSWTTISGGDWGSIHMFAEYNPVHGVVWLGSGNGDDRRTYRLDANLNLTRMANAPFSLNIPNAIQVADPVSGKYLVLNRNNNTWWEFDIIANQWSQISGMSNKPGISTSVIAVPLPEHGAIMLYNENPRRVHVYRHTASSGTPSPQVSLTASPSTIDSGGSVTLNWSTSNANSCSASGGWSGNKNAGGGSQTITNITQNTTYTISCSGDGGSSTDSASVTVNSDDPPPGGSADWNARSTAPGVLFATNFPNNASVVDNVLQDSAAGQVSRDTNNFKSGGGALRFEILKTNGTNSGNWKTCWTPDCTNLQPGEEIYLQFRQYTPEYLVNHDWEHSGSSRTGFKQTIISAGSANPSFSSNRAWEVVLTSNNIGYPRLYWQDGVNSAVQSQIPASTGCQGSDFRHQDAIDRGPNPLTGQSPDGDAWTQCEQDRARYGGLYSYTNSQGGVPGPADPLTGAQLYPLDGWATYMVRVALYDDSGNGGLGTSNNTIEAWLAHEGEEFTKIVSRQNVRLGPEDGPEGLNGFWLLPYISRGQPNPNREDTFTLYDEVIVSENFIPAPDSDGGTGGTPPTINLTSSSSTVLSGGTVVLNWNTNNADSCTAAGGAWSGSRPTSGSESVGPLTSTSTFVLNCTNDNGSAGDSVTVTVTDPPSDDFQILQSDDATHSNSYALDGATVSGDIFAFVIPEANIDQVSFYLDDPDQSGAPYNIEFLEPFDFGGGNGFDTTLIGNGSHTLTAAISLSGGSSADVTVSFNVSNTVTFPPPVVNFSATNVSIGYGGFTTLQWNSADANDCVASDGWSGSQALNGSSSVGPLFADTTFTLSCSGQGGTDTASVTILVDDPAPPTLTLSASPGSVAFEGASLLSWNSSNADSCVASGAWSGNRPVNGNENVGPLTADSTYSMTCSGPGGDVTRSTTVNVAAPPLPTVSISATPNPADYNGAATLSWSSDNATSCSASGAWGGNRPTSGSLTIGPLTADGTYTIACTGPGGTRNDSVLVQVTPPPAPQLTISVSPTSVDYEGVTTITWSSSNATSCTASGGWSGARGISGSESSSQLTADTTFSMTCDGPGGDVTRSATVLVGAPPSPTVALTATPENVDFDGASTLQWSSTNATSCTASGGWGGNRPTSGTLTVGPLQSDTQYTITCSGQGQDATDSVTVTVNDPAPTLTFTAQPNALPFNGTTTLNWSTQNATACNASGAWSGTRGTSGNETSNALTADAAFTLTCTGPGGSVTRTRNVTVADPNQPSLSLQASPDQVNAGGSSVLSWSAADVDSCTASGAWSGSRALSGSETVGPINSASTYTLDCTGAGGDISRSVTVNLVTPAPTITINATPSGTTFGGSVIIGWSTTNANSCQAFGGWSGPRATTGGEQINNLTVNTTFTLVCDGDGGQETESITVTVNDPDEPVITFSASPAQVDAGANTTLTWSTENATSCTAAGGWTGNRAVNGSEQVGPINADTNFSLVCNGAGGQSIENVLVQVAGNTPTLTISAAPSSVDFGGETVVTWSTTGANSCQAFGDWSGARATSGTETVSNLTQNSEFVLACSGNGGSVTESTAVTVSTAPAPDITIMADPDSVAFNGTSVISWTSENAASCEAFGSWSGDRGTSGSETVGPLTEDTNYILLCEGTGGSTVRSAQVAVETPDAPQITLSVTPEEIVFGGSVEVTWDVNFATSCTASGGWDGDVGTSGTRTFGPLNATTNYTLICAGPGGNASRSVSVQVGRTANLPLQTFENDAIGQTPAGWYQTAADFSLDFEGGNFLVKEFATNNVLTLENGGQNFHSHYLLNQATLWTDYRYTGRMYISNAADNTGVTVLSDYPNSDAYYSLGYQGTGNFALQARGTACSGDLDTGISPSAGIWYRYSVEAENGSDETTVRAKVWADGADEPADWQATCTDSSATRRVSGAPGLRGARVSAPQRSRWDDLQVTTLDAQTVSPPLISLTATPSLVGIGGSTRLDWSTNDATTCTAGGGWTGSRPVGGQETITDINEDTSFTLVCDGPGGSSSRSVAVAAIDSSVTPIVTFTATPDEVPTGGSTTLSWSSQNASVCVASGDWTGARSTSGSAVVSNIVKDSRFQINCIGPGGNVGEFVDVYLSDIPRDPTLNFDIDFSMLPVDNTVTLRWESRFTSTCTASGDWSGERPRFGVEQVGPIEVSATYTLTCDGSNGSISDTRTIDYVDSDSDGMPDVWERQFFGDLENNGLGDSDGDGLTDREEYTNGTDPFNTDTDGDGDSDYDEVQFGSNPRDPGSQVTGDRPQTPAVADQTGLPLWGFTADARDGYNDSNGDALRESQWEFALDSAFTNIVFARTVGGSTSVMVPTGVLDPGVTYYVRTLHVDVTGAASNWSQTATMRASTSYPNDADNNGVDDDYQAPADADANVNGTPDADEGLCNLYDAEGRSVVGFETNSGVIRCYRSVPNSDLPNSSSVSGETPFGTFSFRVEGLLVDPASPARVFVTVWLPEAMDPDTGWVIYDPATQELLDFSDHVTFNGNRAIIEYVDGGFGDKDGTVNGYIVDPSGPLVAAATPEPPPPVVPPNPGPSEGSGGGGGGTPAPWTLLTLLCLYGARQRRFMLQRR